MSAEHTASSGTAIAGSVGIEPGSRLFVTGATGYIGGRLVKLLLDAGYTVRCLARSPRKLSRHVWVDRPEVEIVQGDLSDPEETARQMRGCRAAYYLVHSMVTAGRSYAQQDATMARDFARAAANADVQRIVYLAGLGEMGDDLSEHLQSRRQVEHELASTNVPVTVLRAAMIIGAGSASFEILRYLVERLPIMVTPKWVRTECQPIAVRNVLHYLVQCLRTPETTGRTLDVGCREILSYQRIMEIMVEELGLPRRWVLPVPVLTPRLSSLWIHLVTPVSARLAQPLAEGLRNRVVCSNDEAQRLMPTELLDVRTSIRLALQRVRQGEVETAWTSSGVIPGDPDWAGGKVFVDSRRRFINASSDSVYRAVLRIGGGNGWYAADGLWHLRGWMDRLVGGPGLRRGRRNPERVGFGEALDFWRVTEIEPGQMLRLRAEMKLPGIALLEFHVEPVENQAVTAHTRLTQTARFLPRGLFGLVYWYAVLPFHRIVFNGMLGGIERTALQIDGGKSTGTHDPSGQPADQRGADSRSSNDASRKGSRPETTSS